jgi:hypothetical protein
MTIEALLKTDLCREFEKTARAAKDDPAKELAEFMAEYIESKIDGLLFDEMQREGEKSGYTEDDAVELVRRMRREMQQKS